MTSAYEYRFRIDAFTSATMPMARLAEYMTDLAMLLGEPERVHFERLDEGSAVLVQRIDDEAAPKVRSRLHAVRAGDAPGEAMKAFESLDRRLAADNATGVLTGPDEDNVICFPGRERPAPLTYGSFRQHGSLDGVLVRLGGVDQSVHGLLQDGTQTWRFETTREMARDLRAHLYEKPLRIFGEGRWRRDPAGKWNLDRFVLSNFEALDDAPWPETVERLRAIKGADWNAVDDPLAELRELRGEGDAPH